MTLDQVFKLIDAGFSKQEILAFETPAGDPAGDPAPAGDPTPEKPAAASDNFDKLLQGITGQLKTLTEAVQLGNIRNAQGAPAKPETPESIIQEMFNVK